jgi:hypothetical protein
MTRAEQIQAAQERASTPEGFVCYRAGCTEQPRFLLVGEALPMLACETHMNVPGGEIVYVFNRVWRVWEKLGPTPREPGPWSDD